LSFYGVTLTQDRPAEPAVDEGELEKREQDELLAALKRATLGEYDIYSPLGQGGMATVFLALELSLNRPVAIKVISPSALSSTTVIDRFWLEARTAASLSHPNVIPIYAVKSNAGLHYFVMKHIQGGSLDTVLKNEGPFSFTLVRTILTQVSGALAYAHRRGIVHRDIKPGNIMLDDEGYAVVMDFGIAKVRDVAALTASGAMVGTPFYMSPEQFSGGTVDGRSDQYSLGVVAFELLAGSRPFKGESIAEVLRGHLIDRAPDIRSIRHDCPTALATLINRMLNKAPEDRFPSMDAVCNQLEAMPRMDTDKVREKIAAFARTASISNPQISTPLSPMPLSRTSSVSIEGKHRSQRSGQSTTHNGFFAPLRRHPILSATAIVAIAGVSSATLLMNHGKIRIAGPSNLAASESPRSLQPLTQNPVIQAPIADSVHSDTTLLPKPLLADTHKAPAPKSEQTADNKKKRADPPLRVIPPAPPPPPAPAENTNSLVPAVDDKEQSPAFVEPPAPKPPPVFSIGSHNVEAVLYIDGQTIGLLNSRMHLFKHDPGRVHVQIKAEDCMTFDTVFVLKEGDSTMIGWRAPNCNR
jgi:serine/threonine protein kinase